MDILNIILDTLRHSILITGLVVVMMMMIESLNIESKGLLFRGLSKTKLGQIIVAAFLGSIPGCMGGFAVVSLYTHRLIGFGALVAMMIASSGDEAFMMLALVPKDAMVLFAILFVIAIVTGYIIELINDRKRYNCNQNRHNQNGQQQDCQNQDGHNLNSHNQNDYNQNGSDLIKGPKNDVGYVVHDEIEASPDHHHKTISWGWKRIVLLLGLAVFILALILGAIGELPAATSHHHTLNTMLNEQWMHILFGILSAILLVVLCFSSDHFINEHIWHHVIRKHLPSLFGWTFGVLLVLGILMQYVDINSWVNSNQLNVILMIILATLIGLIPESGPHMIFVTLFATGTVPFSVLLASSISQDGHASLPLLAESKKGYLKAKLINCLVALLAGFAAMALPF